MRFPGNVVTLIDTRSGRGGAGKPDKCFYCKGVPGGPHDDDCVCIHRPVKIRLTIDMVVTVPRSWTKEQAEFRWNESTYCMDNMLEEIQRHAEYADAGCLCPIASVEYLGEATLREAEATGLRPDSEYDFGEEPSA